MVASRSYIRDGAEIYRNSFAIIRAEADLRRFTGQPRKWPCGSSTLPASSRSRAISPCRETLLKRPAPHCLRGHPSYCDARMVAHGITRSRLPAGNEVICTLDDRAVPELARSFETTRSAAAMELWRPRLANAIVAIGNAPTALFRLLEMIDQGAPKPAAVIGVPVGFVGAAEFEGRPCRLRGLPFLIVRGRKGGSAIAVAAVNALASERE